MVDTSFLEISKWKAKGRRAGLNQRKPKERNSEDAKPAASRPSDGSQCLPIALCDIPQLCCWKPCSDDEESCGQEKENPLEADPSTLAHNKKRSHGNLVKDPEKETIHETTGDKGDSDGNKQMGGGKRLHCTPTSTEQEQEVGIEQQLLSKMSHQLAEANKQVQAMSKRLQSAAVIITQSVKLAQEKEDENRLLRAENAKLLQRNSELSQELASIYVELNTVQSKVLHKDQQIKNKSEQVLYHRKRRKELEEQKNNICLNLPKSALTRLDSQQGVATIRSIIESKIAKMQTNSESSKYLFECLAELLLDPSIHGGQMATCSYEIF
ncbi:hypothetical protein ACA910_010483 [Epithemia clementina (nom. ined.)]